MTSRASKKKKKPSLRELKKKAAKKAPSKKKASKKKAAKKKAAKKKVESKQLQRRKREALLKQFAAVLSRPGVTQAQAYREVISSGCNDNTASCRAKELMKHPVVQRALAEHEQLMSQSEDVRKDWAVEAARDMVDTDIIDLLDDEGFVLPLSTIRAMPKGLRRAIKEFTVQTVRAPEYDEEGNERHHPDGTPIYKTTQVAEVKLHDKIKALELVAKLKQWIQGTSITIDLGQKIQEAENRVRNMKEIEGEWKRTGND